MKKVSKGGKCLLLNIVFFVAGAKGCFRENINCLRWFVVGRIFYFINMIINKTMKIVLFKYKNNYYN